MSDSTMEIVLIDKTEVLLVLAHIVSIECASDPPVVRCSGGISYAVSRDQADLIKSALTGGG